MRISLVPLSLIIAASLGSAAAETSLTIYNGDFAVVRDTLKLDLKAGPNQVRYSDVALYAEPTSVILRDLSGKAELQIQEQSFRGGAVNQETMLAWFEGQSIDFLRYDEGKSHVIQGKIIRAGRARSESSSSSDQKIPPVQPMIEVNGKVQFELPGTPLFPSPGQERAIKPEFTWTVASQNATEVQAEVAYTTYAINWVADYNIIASEEADTVQVLGWITIDNETGKNFENAKVKFVAGMMSKLDPRAKAAPHAPSEATTERVIVTGSYIPIEAKDLDEYYIYTHPSPISIHDREQKQVQFLRAESVQAKKIFSYYGSANDARASGNNADLTLDANAQSVTTVSVVREFRNSAANHLGVPLPRGRMRFFKRSADQQLEFIGESDSGGTPVDEKVEATTGSAFDLVAERTRTSFEVDPAKHTATESFEIKLRNHKKEPVEIRVTEPASRWHSWEVTEKSDPFTKKEGNKLEFNVPVKPGEERKLSYTIRYTNLPARNDAP
ncbi:MAG: hypothetical protein QOH88_1341 [Verrucomicrobiota bacterium]|jgi:hypothetical protein